MVLYYSPLTHPPEIYGAVFPISFFFLNKFQKGCEAGIIIYKLHHVIHCVQHKVSHFLPIPSGNIAGSYAVETMTTSSILTDGDVVIIMSA